MNKKRLTILADYLGTLPPESLDMRNWSCGTAACAVGHACAIPKFNEQGFRFYMGGYGNYPLLERLTDSPLTSWNAVVAFFGLTYSAACHLFDHRAYTEAPSPSFVACRIKAYVKLGKATDRHGYIV